MIKHDKFQQSSLDSGMVPLLSSSTEWWIFPLCSETSTHSVKLCFSLDIDMPVVVHVKVVDYPVCFPWSSYSRPQRFPSCSLLIRCSMSLLCRSSRFVRSCGRRSRSHSCSSFSPGQVVARPLCATTDALGRCPSQFIDSCVRPCD